MTRGPFARYVAIGDSSTEGLDDPDGRGGWRGWADRFAAHVASAQPSPLLYANLAVRGRKSWEVRAEQLPAALAMRPDLATVFAGTNDVLRRDVDLDQVADHLETMQRALIGQGALVLTISLPDLAAVNPLARLVDDRVQALNARLRDVASRTGALLVDLAQHPVAGDPRLWSDDRLHANHEGHARIARALAHAIGLTHVGDGGMTPLPPAPPASLLTRAGGEWRWLRRHFAPWLLRRMTGRSSGDRVRAKRPALTPVELSAD